MDIYRALLSLRPGAKWHLDGTNYSNIQWLELSELLGGQSQPTKEEVIIEIERLQAEYENKEINGYKVIFTEVNCTNESPEVEKMMDTYKIDGFPTIKLLKDGQVIEYDAKPTKETMEQFLNTVL